MTNLPVGVSMVDSIGQCVWMNLMHSDFITTRKSVSLIVINFFPLIHEFRDDNELFQKGKSVRKGPPK
jgi:hypothetical protein